MSACVEIIRLNPCRKPSFKDSFFGYIVAICFLVCIEAKQSISHRVQRSTTWPTKHWISIRVLQRFQNIFSLEISSQFFQQCLCSKIHESVKLDLSYISRFRFQIAVPMDASWSVPLIVSSSETRRWNSATDAPWTDLKGAVTRIAPLCDFFAPPWLSVANAGTLTETARKIWGEYLFLMFMFSAFVNHLSRILWYFRSWMAFPFGDHP